MTFPVTNFPKDQANYITPSWAELHQLAFELSEQILAGGHQFDRIITLAKGGWPMTRSLVDFLGVNQVASVGIKFYQGINRRMNMPEVYQDLPVKIKGERVLLFDDVADTGESLEFTTQYLRDHGVAEVKCATLFYKPHSQYKPDFYASETDAWIIFPYETFESMRQLLENWKKQGIDQNELITRFSKMGFEDRYINQFQKLYNL